MDCILPSNRRDTRRPCAGRGLWIGVNHGAESHRLAHEPEDRSPRCAALSLSCHTHALTHNRTNTDKQVGGDARVQPFDRRDEWPTSRDTRRGAWCSARFTAITSSSHTIAKNQMWQQRDNRRSAAGFTGSSLVHHLFSLLHSSARRSEKARLQP